jgi:hypothetical protein
MNRAPTSGSSRPWTTTVPSSSWWTRSARLACRRLVSRASALRSTQRQPRTIRSTWDAVPARPTPSSRASVSGVATRVRARTLAYDSSPRASAWARSGSVPRARATRTFSRAAPRSSPIRQLSQWAQERNPLFQPPRVSNARMRSRRRAVAASRCADNSAISSPRRSSSAMRSGVGFRPAGMSGEWISMASLPCVEATVHPGFGAARERSVRGTRERTMIFHLVPPCRQAPGSCGPLRGRPSGAADTRRRHPPGLSSGKVGHVTPRGRASPLPPGLSPVPAAAPRGRSSRPAGRGSRR